MCYSADGQNILAGGMSKFVCLYHVREQILVKRFELSCNFSLDAMEVSSGMGHWKVFWLHGPWVIQNAGTRVVAMLA